MGRVVTQQINPQKVEITSYPSDINQTWCAGLSKWLILAVIFFKRRMSIFWLITRGKFQPRSNPQFSSANAFYINRQGHIKQYIINVFKYGIFYHEVSF